MNYNSHTNCNHHSLFHMIWNSSFKRPITVPSTIPSALAEEALFFNYCKNSREEEINMRHIFVNSTTLSAFLFPLI
jgi:hypothetical protein